MNQPAYMLDSSRQVKIRVLLTWPKQISSEVPLSHEPGIIHRNKAGIHINLCHCYGFPPFDTYSENCTLQLIRAQKEGAMQPLRSLYTYMLCINLRLKHLENALLMNVAWTTEFYLGWKMLSNRVSVFLNLTPNGQYKQGLFKG